jgi:preprotein translocase subunit SecD
VERAKMPTLLITRIGRITFGAAFVACIGSASYCQVPDRFEIRLVDETLVSSQQTPPDADRLPTAESDKKSGDALWLKRNGQLGSDALSDAYACVDFRSGGPTVHVTLTPSAGAFFAELTRRNIHGRLAIVVKGKIVMDAVIFTPILDGEMEISGNLTTAESERLAAEIRGVELPASPASPKPCPASVPEHLKVG